MKRVQPGKANNNLTSTTVKRGSQGNRRRPAELHIQRAMAEGRPCAFKYKVEGLPPSKNVQVSGMRRHPASRLPGPSAAKCCQKELP